MTNDKFTKIVEYVKETLITKTLIKKGKEYTRGKDRLSNFRRMAAIQRCTPEKALVGALSKHLASILDMVDDLDVKYVPVIQNDIDIANLPAPLSQWDEKLGDAINYLILLRALVEERGENKSKQPEFNDTEHPVCNDH